jgi:NAD(P)-dependent dehydrogenase (short-subunit alcohol dehydrogenase family)
MKTAIVTGASSGFGKLISIELAKMGFHVISTMRDIRKADQLVGLAIKENIEDRIHIHPLDVTSSESIRSFKKYVNELNKADVLVNNAGYAQGGFCEELTLEAYRDQFETNFFGVIAVTQAILPIMRTKGTGKIINMSSISGKFGFPGLSAYAASKHALEGFSESLRLELKPFGIEVVLVEPGSYKTNIWSGIETVTIKDQSPYEGLMSAILNEVQNGKTDHGDPMEVAKLVAKIAMESTGSELRYPIGKGVGMNIFLKNILPWKMIENVVVKKLKR